MLPDWVSNPGPLTYESGAILIALRGPAPVSKLNIETLLYQCGCNDPNIALILR